MNKEQENFDDLLRSKLEEIRFDFNEANWDKAESLIIAADKKRKKRRIAIIFFIGMLAGIGAMIPFTYTGIKTESRLTEKGANRVAENPGFTEGRNSKKIIENNRSFN